MGGDGVAGLSVPRIGSLLQSQLTQVNNGPSSRLHSLFAGFCISQRELQATLFPSLQNIPESISSFSVGITSPAPALWLFLSCSLCPFDLLKMSFFMLLMKMKLNLGSRAGEVGAGARLCCLRPWLGCLPATERLLWPVRLWRGSPRKGLTNEPWESPHLPEQQGLAILTAFRRLAAKSTGPEKEERSQGGFRETSITCPALL